MEGAQKSCLAWEEEYTLQTRCLPNWEPLINVSHILLKALHIPFLNGIKWPWERVRNLGNVKWGIMGKGQKPGKWEVGHSLPALLVHCTHRWFLYHPQSTGFIFVSMTKWKGGTEGFSRTCSVFVWAAFLKGAQGQSRWWLDSPPFLTHGFFRWGVVDFSWHLQLQMLALSRRHLVCANRMLISLWYLPREQLWFALVSHGLRCLHS